MSGIRVKPLNLNKNIQQKKQPKYLSNKYKNLEDSNSANEENYKDFNELNKSRSESSDSSESEDENEAIKLEVIKIFFFVSNYFKLAY